MSEVGGSIAISEYGAVSSDAELVTSITVAIIADDAIDFTLSHIKQSQCTNATEVNT